MVEISGLDDWKERLSICGIGVNGSIRAFQAQGMGSNPIFRSNKGSLLGCGETLSAVSRWSKT